MKKVIIALLFLLFISPMFAKTIQCVKRYKAWENYYDKRNKYKSEIVPQLEDMLSEGWKIVSITPISAPEGLGSTDYVIVVFEKEE